MAFCAPLPRRLQPEIMDQPGLEVRQHAQALRGLGRINRWSGSAGILWPPLAALAQAEAPRTVRILDLASGGGDVVLRLAEKARRAGLAMQFEGCDLSPGAVDHARREAERRGVPLRFFVADALALELLPGYDAVVSSLFLHHLTEEQAVTLLRRMGGTAGRLVLVNDLVRSRTGLWLARVGTRVLSRSRVVHIDGPRSVAGAFTIEEARHLAAQAGMTEAIIERRWPCRFLLAWVRK